METDGRYETLSKKEISQLEKEKRKLQKNLEGIRNMSRLPDALFVVDTRKEKIAVDEARKLKIPVIGVVDTNCDPDEVDYVIPGNDDALRAIRLFASKIADAVARGRGMRESAQADDSAEGGGDGRRRAAPAPGRPAPNRRPPPPRSKRRTAARDPRRPEHWPAFFRTAAAVPRSAHAPALTDWTGLTTVRGVTMEITAAMVKKLRDRPARG